MCQFSAHFPSELYVWGEHFCIITQNFCTKHFLHISAQTFAEKSREKDAQFRRDSKIRFSTG